MNWTDIVVRGIVVAAIALAGFLILRNARNAGKTEADLRAQLAGEKTKADIVEKSNESAEAAAARHTTSSDDLAAARVRGDALPSWAKR